MFGEPRLYDLHDRIEAIAVFGPEAEARSLCDGQWVILSNVVICFAEIGEPPKSSHFTSGGDFCWVANKPFRVGDDRDIRFVPPEVVSPHADRPIQLFVRPQHSDRHCYVGELAPACMFTAGGKDNFGEAQFSLSPALPSEIWIGFGGLRPGDLDHAHIDAALDRLRHPIDVKERLWVLQQLVAYWHGPIRPEDGLSENELAALAIPIERSWWYRWAGRRQKVATIPDPLRWWYRWAGCRREIISGQNELLAPEKLLVRDDRLVFYAEAQWCYEWATLFEGDDPPVFGRSESTDPWEPEGMALSEHLILACLFEAIVCHSPYGASTACMGEDILDRIVEQIPPIAISPWHWSGLTRFYARGGAFMYSSGEYDIHGKLVYWVHIGAKTEYPLQFLKPFINEDWEHVAV